MESLTNRPFEITDTGAVADHHRVESRLAEGVGDRFVGHGAGGEYHGIDFHCREGAGVAMAGLVVHGGIGYLVHVLFVHTGRTVIATITENRILGLATGIVVTILLNSSSATTVMLVNFVSTSLMSLSQAMAVTLGASIGTTVTVQIISFKVSHYALLLVAIGVAMMYGSSRRQARYMGQLVLSFGFIFYGMQLMGDATAPLKDAAAFKQMLDYLGQQPWAGFLGAALFTGIVQASAATIGLLISLAIGGTMTVDVALPMVLGANVGTAVTALLAGLGSNPEGKRVAIAHMAYRSEEHTSELQSH